MENIKNALAAWQKNEILSNDDILRVLKHLKDTQFALQLCGFKYVNAAKSMFGDILSIEQQAKARNLPV